MDLIRKAALAALKAMKPVNELQTMRVEIMKLSIDADVVLDLHCDMDAALHLFTAAPDIKGAAQELAADLGVQATMYNEPFAEALTFSGVNGALWPRLAARFPDAAIPQACFSSTVELRSQHEVSARAGRLRAQQPLPLSRAARRHRRTRGPAAAPEVRADADQRHGRRLLSGRRLHRLSRSPPERKCKRGDVVCEIIDPADPRGPKARTPMRSRTDGMLFSRKRDGGLAWPGMVAYRIAGAKPLAHRKGMSGLDD